MLSIAFYAFDIAMNAAKGATVANARVAPMRARAQRRVVSVRASATEVSATMVMDDVDGTGRRSSPVIDSCASNCARHPLTSVAQPKLLGWWLTQKTTRARAAASASLRFQAESRRKFARKAAFLAAAAAFAATGKAAPSFAAEEVPEKLKKKVSACILGRRARIAVPMVSIARPSLTRRPRHFHSIRRGHFGSADLRQQCHRAAVQGAQAVENAHEERGEARRGEVRSHL